MKATCFVCQDELRDEVRTKVKWKVNRQTPEDKLRDFLKWMLVIRKDKKYYVRKHITID